MFHFILYKGKKPRPRGGLQEVVTCSLQGNANIIGKTRVTHAELQARV